MDKYEIVLDIIEHPQNYTSEQLAEILSDKEAKDIYNLLSTTESAIDSNNKIDIDSEWRDFSRKHFFRNRNFTWLGNRAATIMAIILASVAAIVAGVVTSTVLSKHQEASSNNSNICVTATLPTTVASDTVIALKDTVNYRNPNIIFEDKSLETIMKTVAKVYDVEIRFNNNATASLHLYFKLDTTLPLDEIISQLNTFEQINIKHKGNILTID